jgi:ParB-like chromosome segregation protein Spo0J
MSVRLPSNNGDDKPATPRLEVRRLKDLVPFPGQQEFFGDTSEDRLQALADDIKQFGLKDSIQILPANRAGYPENTVIGGHRRTKALLLNGVKKKKVLVRHDLADADASRIELEFIRDNDDRRNLDKLAQARVALRRYEIERGRGRGKLRGSEAEEARDRVGRSIGMSGRNLDRYLQVLRTPNEVQNAFQAGQLSLVNAGKVANFPAKIQAEIADRVRDGESPKEVLAEYLPGKDRPHTHTNVNNAVASLCRSLVRGHDDLQDRVDEVPTSLIQANRPGLQKGFALLRNLLGRLDNAPRRRPRRYDEEE